MESQFFSKDNYNIIFNTVNKNLFLDKGLDSKPILNEMKLAINNSREFVLKENLHKVKSMVGTQETKVTALNKAVLRNVVPQINKFFKDSLTKSGLTSDNINRGREVNQINKNIIPGQRALNTRVSGSLNDRMEEMQKMRETKHVVNNVDFTETEKSFTNINDSYEQMMKERDNILDAPKEKKTSIDNILPEPNNNANVPNTETVPTVNDVTTDTEKPFSNFNDSLDSFFELNSDQKNVQERDDRFKEVTNNMKEKGDVNASNTIKIDMAQFTKTIDSLNNERNNEDTINDLSEADPKQLYDNILGNTSLNKMDVLPGINENEKEDLLIEQDKSNNVSIENHILVNGGDRNWYGSWETIDVVNNEYKYIAPTEIYRYNFVVKLGHDDKSNSLNIINTFHNVSSVKLNNVYVTKGDNMGDIRFYVGSERIYLDVYRDVTTFPYMLLSIDELNQVNVTTSKKRFKYFTDLNYKNDITHDNVRKLYSILSEQIQTENDIGRNYIKLESTNTAIYHEHLQKLDRMTIGLLQPNGLKYFPEVDDLIYIKEIRRVDQGFTGDKSGFNWQPETLEFIKLVFEETVDKSQFNIGDKVLLKNLRFSNLEGSQNNVGQNITWTHTNPDPGLGLGTKDYSNFIDFLNRDDGHLVYDTEVKEIDRNIKRISSISIPLEYSVNKTDLKVINKHTEFLKWAQITTEESPQNIAFGQILNQTLQMSLSFTVTTEEYRISE